MRFTAEHRFPSTPAQVAAVLGDPAFYRALELPDLRLLDVRTIGDPDPTSPAGGEPPEGVGLLLRYEFTGDLDPIARRLLGGAQLTWSQEVHLRGDTGGRLTFAAEANPGILHGDAEFVLAVDRPARDAEGGGDPAGVSTVRRLDGELVVALPVVGAVAERRIVPGILARLDAEANAVRERLVPGHRASDQS